jgi:hypothetical protein
MRRVGNWVAEQAVVSMLVAGEREGLVDAFKRARRSARGLEAALAVLEQAPVNTIEEYEALRSALVR